MKAKATAQTRKRLGERLIEAGLIDEIQLTVALGMQGQSGLKLGKQLMKLGFISEAELSEFLKEETDFNTPLHKRNITDKAVKAVPSDLAFKFKVMPIAFAGNTIVLAMADPADLKVTDALAFQLGKNIHPVKALEWDIESALLKYYKFFSDEELEGLTSASTIADQYRSMNWNLEGEFDAAILAVRKAEGVADVSGAVADPAQGGEEPSAEAESAFRDIASLLEPTAHKDATETPARRPAAQSAAPQARPSAPAQQRRTPSPTPVPVPSPDALAPSIKAQALSADKPQGANPLLQKALIELLIQKGVISKQEIMGKYNALRQKPGGK